MLTKQGVTSAVSIRYSFTMYGKDTLTRAGAYIRKSGAVGRKNGRKRPIRGTGRKKWTLLPTTPAVLSFVHRCSSGGLAAGREGCVAGDSFPAGVSQGSGTVGAALQKLVSYHQRPYPLWRSA